MTPTLTATTNSAIPDQTIQRVLRAALPHRPGVRPSRVERRAGFTSDLAEVHLPDGAALIVKRGRHPWSRERMAAARAAGELLRGQASIQAPAPLDLPAGLDAGPVEAYWRIPLPTLAELWPALRGEPRRLAARSLGELVRRVHGIRLLGHGPLTRAGLHTVPLTQHLAEDIGARLLPAVRASWPAGAPLAEALLGLLPELARHVVDPPSLLHGDLHAANVLCAPGPRGVSCVGVLDLEAAHAGPPESDLARLSVTQSSLFDFPIDGEWLEWVIEGYGRAPDPVALAFYRVYHLVDLGFHTALCGHHPRAAEVERAARAGLQALHETVGGSGTRAPHRTCES